MACRGVGKAVGRRHHVADHAAQVDDHLADAAGQQIDRLVAFGHDIAGQVALRRARHRVEQGVDLAAVVGGLGLDAVFQVHLVGDVDGELDHFIRLAVQVQDGVVGGLYPHHLAMVAQALVAARVEFAAVELLPEFLVFGAAGILGFAEHAVVLALDIAQVVVHDGEEIVVRVQHIALHVEFDHGLRLADGADLAFVFGIAHFQGRDVGGELDDFVGLAVGVEDRVVGSIDPDFAAILGHGACIRPGRTRRVPGSAQNCCIRPLLAYSGSQNIAWCLPCTSASGVAEDAQEVVIGVQDGAVEVEFDHGLHTVQCAREWLAIQYPGHG